MLDSTSDLQQILDDNPDAVFPAGEYGVSTLDLHSDQTLTMHPRCRLVALPSPSAQRGMLRINNRSNVSISGGVIDGDKANNPGGMIQGVQILGGSEISLSDMRILNVPMDPNGDGNYGDGVYIGSGPDFSPVRNVALSGLAIDACDRHCVMVANVQGLTIGYCTLTNTSSNVPGSAINLEPNQTEQDPSATSQENINDVLILGCTITGNEYGLTSLNHYGPNLGRYTAIRLIGNVVRFNRQHGFHLARIGEGLIVSGNTITDNGLVNGGCGIKVSGSDRGFKIVNNPAINRNTDGILLDAGCQYWAIEGNSILENRANGANISMSSTPTDLAHHGIFGRNFCGWNGTNGLWLHEIPGGHNLDVHVTECEFVGNVEWGARAIDESQYGTCRGVSWLMNRWQGNAAGELDGAVDHFRMETRYDQATGVTSLWINGLPA